MTAIPTIFPHELHGSLKAALQTRFSAWITPSSKRVRSTGFSLHAVDIAAPVAQTTAMDPADARDISLTQKGDGSAYERLIRRHQQAIARRMARFSHDPRQLEELTHDVFVEAFFSLRTFRGEAPFGHWLMGIATRVGYKFWKQQTRQRQQGPMPEIAVTTPEVDDSLGPVLAKLPARDRIVVTLMYLEERSVAETAKILGWTQTMVKVQAFRARGKLRKMMTESPSSQETKGRDDE